MPDADWVHYRQIRGGSLPEAGDWLGARWTLNKILKRDFYAVTGIYDRAPGEDTPQPDAPEQILVKVYHTEPFGPIPLGFLGRSQSRREARLLEHLDGVEGVPRLLGRFGESGLIREFVPGRNLREHGKNPPPDERFFPDLAHTLDEVHRRGVSHNDLSKPENVLVRADGRPVLIDFQIALHPNAPERSLFGWLARKVLGRMQNIDRYHLTKLHRRFRSFDFTPEQLEAARRKGWLITLHGFVRRPYRAIRHRVLKKVLRANPTTPAG